MQDVAAAGMRLPMDRWERAKEGSGDSSGNQPQAFFWELPVDPYVRACERWNKLPGGGTWVAAALLSCHHGSDM